MPSSPPSLPTSKRHSRLSPSASKRWLSCRASPGLIAKHAGDIDKDEQGSRYSREGTEAHDYATRLLQGEKRVVAPRNSEMVACIADGYVPFVRELVEQVDGQLLVEEEVPLFYAPKDIGTTDTAIIAAEEIIIVDLKYGTGISVEAKFNSQLAIYAESTIRVHRPKCRAHVPVTMVIYQPRAQDGRFVRKWKTTRGELATFCKAIEEAALDILSDPDGQPFAPDAEHTCRFCPVKAQCSAYAGHLLEEMPASVSTSLATTEKRLALPEPKSLSNGQLVKLLRVRGDMEKWLAEIAAHVQRKMEKGTAMEGLKLVASRSARQWVDETEVATLLRTKAGLDSDDIYSRRLVSPAVAEKLLKPLDLDSAFYKRLLKLTEKPEGKPVVALKEDPRPPLETNAADDFDNEDAARML